MSCLNPTWAALFKTSDFFNIPFCPLVGIGDSREADWDVKILGALMTSERKEMELL